MPAKSKKQYQFMKAVAKNKKFADKVGVPQSVGKEFTKVKKYDKGGQLKYATKNEKLYDKLPKEYKDMYSFGEFVTLPDFEKAVLRSNPKGRDVKIPGKKKGGKIGMGMTKNNYKKGGSVKCKRDGICVRGKTKGRMV